MAFVDNLPTDRAPKKIRPKRILYVEGNVDGTVGGSYYVLYDLVMNLDKKKYSPVVVFYFDNFLVSKLQESGIETYVIDPVQPIILPFKNSTHFVSYAIYQVMRPLQRLFNIFKRFVIPGVKLKKFLKQKHIDLVNLNNSVTRNHEWMLAASLAGTPCMTHEMGINAVFSPLSKFFAYRMKAIVTVSHAVANNMRMLGLDYQNIFTIHNGIDLNRYQCQRTPDQIRDQFNIDPDRPVIGVIGNIKVWKGQETVVRATYFIKQVFPAICCFLIGDVAEGDRSYCEQLQRLCTELGLEQNVVFAGFQENPIDFMNMVDIVIHPSIDPEPFGIVNLEAMSVRKPVISTTIGAPVEIFENGISGILVDPGDPEALAQACLSILKSPTKAKAIGDAGYSRLQKEFTIQQMVSKNEKIYHQLLYE